MGQSGTFFCFSRVFLSPNSACVRHYVCRACTLCVHVVITYRTAAVTSARTALGFFPSVPASSLFRHPLLPHLSLSPSLCRCQWIKRVCSAPSNSMVATLPHEKNLHPPISFCSLHPHGSTYAPPPTYGHQFNPTPTTHYRHPRPIPPP